MIQMTTTMQTKPPQNVAPVAPVAPVAARAAAAARKKGSRFIPRQKQQQQKQRPKSRVTAMTSRRSYSSSHHHHHHHSIKKDTNIRRRTTAQTSSSNDDDYNANDINGSNKKGVAREIEFMVEMRCGKCVEKVEKSVLSLEGVIQVSASLGTNTVRVLATSSVKTVEEKIASTGYKTRLVGQGNVELFNERLAERLGMDLRTLRQSLAAVAEFKGEAYQHGSCKGVVRFVQVNEETATFEADVLGLEKGKKYKLRVRMYGDTTRGVESCGEVYQNTNENEREEEILLGEMCAVQAMEDGSIKASLQLPKKFFVWDIIGRALCIEEVVAGNEEGEGLRVAAVLARSAGVGENLKKVCQCDGTVIWESSPDDFTPQISKKGGSPLFENEKVSVKRM
jgi:copper chaperone for superoxide dismutase